VQIFDLMLAASVLLATPAENAAAAGTSPYSLHGALQAEPPARADARFTLRARLTPTDAARPLQADARLPSARLKSIAACPTPGSIFASGFEGP
jgi:hypothetical protein